LEDESSKPLLSPTTESHAAHACRKHMLPETITADSQIPESTTALNQKNVLKN
jgi:hypothetical protein